MKVFVILSFFVALSAASLDYIPKSKLPMVKECYKETGGEDEKLEQFFTGCMSASEYTEICGCFFKCVMTKFNVMNAEGDIDQEKARELSDDTMEEVGHILGVDMTKAEVDALIDECADEVEGEKDLCKKASKLQTCVMRKIMDKM